MKSKYEISIWEDVLSEDGSFEEQKLIVIGSDTMTSESRACEPKLINNINGTNKFSFNMHYRYIDTRTGEEIENPYVKYLVNERKIKVFWKDAWYDFIIKQVKEDQVNHVFSYTCEDAFITELSRNGFNLVFNTELENNIGTARELVEKVVEGTDWKFDEKGSDIIYQKIEEPVYEVLITNDFNALQNPDNTSTLIQADFPALIYYSSAPDKDNLKSSIQFYYNGSNEWQQDENNMLVINGNCYSVDVTWSVNDNKATASVNGLEIFTLNFASGLSTNYRAERYVQSQKTIYNSIVDRYVNVYNNGELLGYQTTEFNDALAVVNLVTNPSNFSNISGWIGESLQFKLSPSFGKDTKVSEYTAKSYLYMRTGTYFNTGIQNNRSYITNGFSVGENYILRIRLKNDGEEPADTTYVTNPDLVIPSIQSRNIDYKPTGTHYFNTTKSFYDEENKWLEYDMTCIKSCPYEMILSSSFPFGIFIYVNGNYWLEEVQFYREVFGNTGSDNDIVRINPGEMDKQSVAQTYWKYFNAVQPDGVTKDSLEYVYSSLKEWDEAQPVYNNFERYGTIEESNSNRFNILQSIAEAFECWVFLEVKHDDKGYITHDEKGSLQKYIRLKREAGQETGIGFIYGIDLKGIVRDIKSDKISTKTIVEQNENQFGKNGFCSIARSEQNYPRENVIYNFDYYIQQGLLNKDVLYNDLYNTTGMAYYAHLHELNSEYAKNLDNLLNKRTELTRQNATATVYNQYILSSKEELQSVEESIMKMAGVNDIDAGLEYAKNHIRDTKTQSLVDNRSSIKETLRIYQNLNESLQRSLETLNDYINSMETRQDEIIRELNTLNKKFNVKYARFIQEGTWTSEDYWNDDLYYLDAVQVAYISSRPQISYEISVLRLSDIEEYSSKVFKLGDISFIQDTKYFGYLEDRITPYKEKVILTEITSYFDTPDKDTIKVQNYKTQFDDLFQRITAAVQNLEFNEGKYAKAANIVASDGTIKSSIIQNTFNENKDLVYGAQNESATIDNTGITVTDNANAAKQVKITSGGIFVTNDGGTTWKNAIRGDGISADVVTTGKLNTELISIYNADVPSFTWDAYGINAYMLDEGGHVEEYTEDDTVTAATFNDNIYYKKVNNDYVIAEQYEPDVVYYLLTDYNSTYAEVENITADNFIKNYYYIKENDKYILATEFIADKKYYIGTRSTQYNQYVRFDKYGIYGIKNKTNYRPISEAQIYEDASFGLTWSKFFMKSKNGDKFIEISTDRDIVVSSGGVERIVIGRVDGSLSDNYGIRVKNEKNEVVFQCDNYGSFLSGWTLTKEYLESQPVSELVPQTIKIYADGNIGCYGSEQKARLESVYQTQVITNFTGIGLNTGNRTFTRNSVIYVFTSSVGKTKTQRQVGGGYNIQYMTPTLEYVPTPSSVIQIATTEGNKTYNYNVTEVEWIVSLNKATYQEQSISVGTSTSKNTTYTYTFDLTAKKGGQIIFTLPYTDTFDTSKEKYIPAMDTKWYIDNNGDAIFHEIMADGGSIAGWWIDGQSIYQTYDGTRNKTKNGKNNIKTELNSSGTASVGNFDYSIITDAINAAMASIGGVLMSSGLINGYSIAQIAAQASQASGTAWSALNKANDALTKAQDALEKVKSLLKDVDRIKVQYNQHIHSFDVASTPASYLYTRPTMYKVG